MTIEIVQVSTLTDRVIGEVERAIVGKTSLLQNIMAAVLTTGGHVLLEDYPGLAKTLIAKSFSTALGLTLKRFQFTPDRPPATSRAATSMTAPRANSNCVQVRFSLTSFWPTRSTVPRPRPSPRFWRRCKKFR